LDSAVRFWLRATYHYLHTCVPRLLPVCLPACYIFYRLLPVLRTTPRSSTTTAYYTAHLLITCCRGLPRGFWLPVYLRITPADTRVTRLPHLHRLLPHRLRTHALRGCWRVRRRARCYARFGCRSAFGYAHGCARCCTAGSRFACLRIRAFRGLCYGCAAAFAVVGCRTRTALHVLPVAVRTLGLPPPLPTHTAVGSTVYHPRLLPPAAHRLHTATG